MKKKTAALIGAIAGAPFGLVGAGVGSAIGAWLGEREDEDSSFQSNDEAAIVLAPAGVHLNESNMTIPWDKVYSVELDEDDDTVNVFFVGGLLVFSEDYDFEDGWDKFYPDATPEEDDMDEDEMFIFKIGTDSDGNDLFIPVEDEETLQGVYDVYLEEAGACEDDCDCCDHDCDHRSESKKGDKK